MEDYLKKHAVIEEAVKASTVNQIIHAFKGTEYWSVLNTGLKNYEENGSTTCFDVFIDKLFYENLYDSYNCLPKKEKQYAIFLRKHRKRWLYTFNSVKGKTFESRTKLAAIGDSSKLLQLQ